MTTKMSSSVRVKSMQAVRMLLQLRWPTLNKPPMSDPSDGKPLGCLGLTLVELMITISIVMTLVGIAMPILGSYVEKARSTKVVSDMRTTLEAGISLYEVVHGVFPASLAEISRGAILDPWGNTYQYLNIIAGGPGVRGHARKDRYLVPLNSDYDLYSMGKDGRSVAPLTSRWSRDDIIRANDGDFWGLASDF